MKYVLCIIGMLCFFSTYANEVYHVRVGQSDSITLIPLSSINSMSVTIVDTVEFDYRINITGLNLVDCKIYADAPLYDRIEGRICEIQKGFNVNFPDINWLLEFLSKSDLVVSEKHKSTYFLVKLYNKSIVSNQTLKNEEQ